MPEQKLGRLTQIKNLREQWPDEAGDFTPWLAREENLAILGEALGLELELEAQEQPIESYRADILCRDTGSDAVVVIENQLEQTDHKHLGQLLTYASGSEAATIIWIAARFTKGHLLALDWLNRNTDEDFRFFGLEVELWCIGDSPRAPKFNIVSNPEDWSPSGERSARAKRIETNRWQLDYWRAFSQTLKEANGPVSSDRQPKPDTEMQYSIGGRGFNLSVVMVPSEKKIRAELRGFHIRSRPFYHLLKKQRQEIEHELGYRLKWTESPSGKTNRIAVYLDDTNPEDEGDWAVQHNWLAEKLNQLHQVFYGRLQQLNPEDWEQEQEESDTA